MSRTTFEKFKIFALPAKSPQLQTKIFFKNYFILFKIRQNQCGVGQSIETSM